MAETVKRDQAIDLAKTDMTAALEVARRISEPWYRCQALAWTARYAQSESVAVRIAEEASRVAEGADDAYEAVGSVAWAVRALLEREHPVEAEAIMGRATSRAQQIANPVRRVVALYLLVQAGWPSRGPGWFAAVANLVAAARNASSWRSPTVLRDLVLMLAGADLDFEMTLAAMPEGPHKRQTMRRLDAKEFLKPRDFFW